MKLLEVKELIGGYGGVNVLNGINLTINYDQIVVIVGPNGAGKSTAMKAIFGLVNITSGNITYKEEDITSYRPDRVAKLKIAYVPQEKNVFSSMTVNENLEMGAFLSSGDKKILLEKIYSIFPPLADKRRQAANTLSGGQRQMVAIGRALMLEPKLLLLDEPTAGLSPKFKDQIFQKIVEIKNMGLSVLMVEQNARDALAFADKGYVLVMGKNRYEDTGKNLLESSEVAEMFLGG